MANIIRWEPFNDLMSLRDAMDRLFEESFVRPRGTMGSFAENLAIDVYETNDNIIVKTAVPGVKPDDIEVTVSGDLLTIKGEYREDENVDEENYLRRERRYGSFSRSVTLPPTVDADNAQADFENGMLKLTFPKKAEAKPKTIEVKAGKAGDKQIENEKEPEKEAVT